MITNFGMVSVAHRTAWDPPTKRDVFIWAQLTTTMIYNNVPLFIAGISGNVLIPSSLEAPPSCWNRSRTHITLNNKHCLALILKPKFPPLIRITTPGAVCPGNGTFLFHREMSKLFSGLNGATTSNKNGPGTWWGSTASLKFPIRYHLGC